MGMFEYVKIKEAIGKVQDSVGKVYDAIKNAADKQEEYIHFAGIINDTVYEYRNVLSVTGSGKLHSVLSIVDMSSRRTGVKITVNPSTEAEKVIFARRTGHTSGSNEDGVIGVISQDFYSCLQYTSYGYVIPHMGTINTNKKINLINPNDAISDTEITTSGISVQLFKNPIEFSSGLKVDVYCVGQYDVIYSLD